jgi:hypothetical protein
MTVDPPSFPQAADKVGPTASRAAGRGVRDPNEQPDPGRRQVFEATFKWGPLARAGLLRLADCG